MRLFCGHGLFGQSIYNRIGLFLADYFLVSPWSVLPGALPRPEWRFVLARTWLLSMAL